MSEKQLNNNKMHSHDLAFQKLYSLVELSIYYRLPKTFPFLVNAGNNDFMQIIQNNLKWKPKLTLLAPVLITSNWVMYGVKLFFSIFRKVVLESGAIFCPIISDMSFQCLCLNPLLHKIPIIGTLSYEKNTSLLKVNFLLNNFPWKSKRSNFIDWNWRHL